MIKTNNMDWYNEPKILDSSKPNLGFTRNDFVYPLIPNIFTNDIYNGKEIKDILILNPSGTNLVYEDEYFFTYCVGSELELPCESIEAEMKVYRYAFYEGYEIKLSCPLNMLEAADFVCFEMICSNPHGTHFGGYIVKVDHYKSILSKGFPKSQHDQNNNYREQLYPILRHTTMSPHLLFDSFRDILVDVLNEETVRAIFTYFVEALTKSPGDFGPSLALRRAFKSTAKWE